MIIKIDKLMHQDDGDCVIRLMSGKPFCHVAKIVNGYYIYNVQGEQIAQMLFGKTSCDIALANPHLPKESSYTLHLLRGGRFTVSALELDKDDKKFIAKLKKDQEDTILNKAEFTILGDFKGYNYDVYRTGNAVGNVLPHEDDGYFKLRINEGGNIIRVMMLTLAVDRLIFEKPKDRRIKKRLFFSQYK